jgi:drug/metabolite transporter (DMT)-like permease
MNGAYGLVVLSALLHAYWNFVLKSRGGTQVFVGLSKVAEAVIFAPVLAVVLASGAVSHAVPWPAASTLIFVGALLTLANYVALARAYQHGDLSLVYPLSRGAGLLFLPPLGYLVFGERIDALGWLAIALILVGLVVLQLPSLRRGGVRVAISPAALLFSCLAGLAAAGYTVWDKRAITMLPAFVYFYSYSVLVAIAYGLFLLRRHGVARLRAEWQSQRGAIVQVGVCNTLAYLLVLLALRTGTSTYVIALRQLSIVFGVALGAWRFHEALPIQRRIGVLLLLGGCCLVAFAH